MKELRFNSIGVERLRVINDGEGITTLAAGTGCSLRCAYCLNPQCFKSGRPAKSYSLDELIRTVAIDDLYFQATGGGVVFGGGEPLLQADFIHAFRERCPDAWRIYLESSLAVPETEFRKVIRDIDFFLIDIKDMNPKIYRNYTGKTNELTLQNLRLLAEYGLADKTLVRIPLIPGYNTEQDRKNSTDLLESMGFHRFDLFQYEVKLALEKRRKVRP